MLLLMLYVSFLSKQEKEVIFTRPGQTVPELYPFFKILIYPYFLWQVDGRGYPHRNQW